MLFHAEMYRQGMILAAKDLKTINCLNSMNDHEIMVFFFEKIKEGVIHCNYFKELELFNKLV